MKIVQVQQKGVVDEAVQVLSADGVVMHPTETCYGLAADIENPVALAKLYKLKGRDANKPVSILVADLEMAKKYGEFSEKALQLAEKYWPRTPRGTSPWLWPGPLTIIVPRTKNLPENFNVGQEFVGMRCPNHEFSMELVKAFGGPITTTSANLAGEVPLYKADVESFGALAGNIALVVAADSRRRIPHATPGLSLEHDALASDGGEIPLNKPSTVVRVVGDQVEVLRQGELLLPL